MLRLLFLLILSVLGVIGCTHAYATAYTYDNVGNRLSKNDGVATSNIYNSNTCQNRDQLQTESSRTLTISYSYDGNGQLTSKTGASTTNYAWQDNDRLKQVTVDIFPDVEGQ